MAVRKPVVQIISHINTGDSDPASAARNAITVTLNWLSDKQKLKLPNQAYEGKSFELDATEGRPVAVETLGNVWSLQYDNFDRSVPGRMWRTEISISHDTVTAYFGLRLAVVDTKNDAPYYVKSIPGVVRDLIDQPGLVECNTPVSNKPTIIETEESLDGFTALLQSEHRIRPVILFTSTLGSENLKDAESAATRLAGLAHIAFITEDLSKKFSQQVGREFSAWNGAIRTYHPKFNPQTDEISQHPLATRDWIESRFGGIDKFISMLFASLSERTVRARNIEEDLPSFKTIRQHAIHARIAMLSKTSEGKSERESLLEQENFLLKQQIEEKAAEFNLADEIIKSTENERDQYRAQIFALREIISKLEAQAEGNRPDINYPTDYDPISDWTTQHFAGRIILKNRASRAARKSNFREPELVYKCLERLAREYVDARRLGQPIYNLFDDLGVHLERTGDEATLRQWKNEYYVEHRGKDHFLEWHLKKGSDKNDETTLRIYFFYDEDDQQVIVGHLPGHLTNNKT